MIKITENTTLEDLEKTEEFSGFVRLFMDCRDSTWGKLKKVPLIQFNNSKIIDALSHLQNFISKGVRVAYDFWDLKDFEEDINKQNTKLVHFPGKPGYPFVLICPGGGYQSVCSFIEGYPAAMELNRAGYHAFVLNYRVRQNNLMPKPIEDMTKALRFIIENAEYFQIDKKYAVMGFSAGGHLAAEIGTQNLGYIKYGLPKPSAIVLCYAAIDLRTLGKNEIADKFRNTIGGKTEDYCINLHVDSNYPPVFLWQCEDDETIDFKNYHIMCQALKKHGIPYKGVSYKRGGHGLQKPHDKSSEHWIEAAIDFLKHYYQE